MNEPELGAPRLRSPVDENSGNLDRAVRRLIKMNAIYVGERAFAKLTITWQDGKMVTVSEERHHKPYRLPKE